MIKKKITLLGTGSSMGVPVIGCYCATCLSSDPHDKRKRVSLFIEWGEKNILVDAGADFREQALENQIDQIDGVILTHTHQDHIAGLDDLRPIYYKQKKTIPVLLLRSSYQEVQRRFFYLFDLKEKLFSFDILDQNKGESYFETIPIQYFVYKQMGMPVMGIRIENFAYLTDIKEYDQTIFSFLDGVENLVISALRPSFSPVHFNFEDAIIFANKAKVKKTIFTHIAHEKKHVEIEKSLPKGFHAGYDGMQIFLSG